jgi:molybdopterin molybdotransferase
MIKVDAALKIILKSIKPLNSEVVKLTLASLRVLADDIYADSDIPRFDNSAMDGYAVKSEDTIGASRIRPKILEVIADLKAGYVTKQKLKKNQAIRIMTGAPIPKGADSVVMVEETKKIRNGEKEFVEIYRETKPQENIRKAGEDIKKGELVIKRGTLIKPAQLGILASLGKPKVKVFRRPRVAILATGDEIVDIDKKLEPGKLRSSNTYTLYSQILNCGGIPENLGIVKDNFSQLEKKIRAAVLNCDLILTSGGVSVGDYDLVKDVLARMGTEIKFWKVAMRPGKPLAFGMIQRIPVFGLPGNPVSSMVVFEIFVRPAILKMLGQKNEERKEVGAVLEENISKKKGFRYFLRAQTRWKDGVYLTRTTGPQGSGILKSMAQANSLIVLPEDEELIKKSGRVNIRFLDDTPR